MKWKEEYETGVLRVDQQHKMIFKMTNDFRLALDEGRGESIYALFLEYLDSYCKAHFNFEEGCMNKLKCPAARKNKKAHLTFVNNFQVYLRRYESSGYSETDARQFIDTVDDWLDDHICCIDVHMKQCIMNSHKDK